MKYSVDVRRTMSGVVKSLEGVCNANLKKKAIKMLELTKMV